MKFKKLEWDFNPKDRSEFNTIPLVAVSKIDIKVLDYFYIEIRDYTKLGDGGGFAGTLFTHNKGSMITGHCKTLENCVSSCEKAVYDFISCFLEEEDYTTSGISIDDMMRDVMR